MQNKDSILGKILNMMINVWTQDEFSFLPLLRPISSGVHIYTVSENIYWKYSVFHHVSDS